MVVRKRDHDLMALDSQFLLKRNEYPITHLLWNALEIAGHQDDALALRIFEGQGLHPEIV
jgi:hypothetical protein